jgi:AhpD family alkylhydroperoxidase
MSAAPRIPLLEREFASPEAQKIYDALLAARGVVPNMFKILAYRPEIAQGVAGFLKSLLSDGALAGSYKELIAIRVSHLHNSLYAVRAHSISARQKGAGEQ